MNHGFEFTVAEETIYPFFIRKIEREKPEYGSYVALRESPILEPGIVIIVQVVHADNLKPILQKPANDMRANKTRGARHQDTFIFYFFHRYLFLTYAKCSAVLHNLLYGNMPSIGPLPADDYLCGASQDI